MKKQVSGAKRRLSLSKPALLVSTNSTNVSFAPKTKLVSVAEMIAIEREADAGGLAYAQMMENAGLNLAHAVKKAYSHKIQPPVALGLVGAGNNGGDTLVALDHLSAWGWEVAALIVRPRPEGDPLVARLQARNVRALPLDTASPQQIVEALAAFTAGRAAVLLDGVLGTGFRLPLKPPLAAILAAVSAFAARSPGALHIVAVDCPSGVDCDSGEAAPECLPAERTVTMAAVKQGLLRFPAFSLAGALEVAAIGDLSPLRSWQSVNRHVADADFTRGALPARPLDAHKGTFGAALVVAGSLNYAGAALLAAEAAYRVGAGLVTLAAPEPLHAALAGRLPEATWVLLPHEHGWIAQTAVQPVRASLPRATALLVGPGFGVEPATQEFLRLFFDGSLPAAFPLVLDADGLKLVSRLPDWPQRLPRETVLTPHPGEMSVLTGLEVAAIQSQRIEIAETYARRWGHVVTLKGAFTVIASPGGETAVLPAATPALARAGSGDVLAGMIAGLRAQGVAAFPAAVAAGWLHAQAGLIAAQRMGSTAAVLAGDVLAAVIPALAGLGFSGGQLLISP